MSRLQYFHSPPVEIDGRWECPAEDYQIHDCAFPGWPKCKPVANVLRMLSTFDYDHLCLLFLIPFQPWLPYSSLYCLECEQVWSCRGFDGNFAGCSRVTFWQSCPIQRNKNKSNLKSFKNIKLNIQNYRAPVAVLYVGGGVYLGGGSGNVAGLGDGERERERDERPDLLRSLLCWLRDDLDAVREDDWFGMRYVRKFGR